MSWNSVTENEFQPLTIAHKNALDKELKNNYNKNVVQINVIDVANGIAFSAHLSNERIAMTKERVLKWGDNKATEKEKCMK